MKIKIAHYLVWIMTAAMYAPVFFNLYSFRWDKVDYTHAYFILPISLWLTLRKKEALKELAGRSGAGSGNLLSLFLLVPGILMFIIGWRQDYLFISTLSLIPVLFGLLLFLYGTGVAKALSFPILYLLLLVPPPFGILDSITLPMRYGISAATETILRFFDYPITRKGLLLTIGYNDIFMGQPCSGFRSLITMFSLVLVYVYIIKGTLGKKLILTAFIIPAALLGNLIRVITLCLITFYFGEERRDRVFSIISAES
ncbi:MAG: exosortase [Deferribacteres bacterium]|nr:exosortase [Deferribacteres bacterium]